MYLNCRVKIPDTGGKITIKLVSGISYVYLEQGRTYNREKKYNVPKRTCIGKQDSEQKTYMFPNEKFLKFFPRELLPFELDTLRSTQISTLYDKFHAFKVFDEIQVVSC